MSSQESTAVMGKRDYEDAFPASSPTPATKRLRSSSPSTDPSQAGPEEKVSSPLTEPNQSEAGDELERQRLEADQKRSEIVAANLALQCQQEEEDAKERVQYLEYARNELKSAIERIKNNTPDGELDNGSIDIMLEDLTEYATTYDDGVDYFKDFRGLRASISTGISPKRESTESPRSPASHTYVGEETQTELQTTDASTSTSNPYTHAQTQTAKFTVPTLSSADFFKMELETIRCEPLINTSEVEVQTAERRLRMTIPEKLRLRRLAQARESNAARKAPREVINLDSSEEGAKPSMSSRAGGGAVVYGPNGHYIIESSDSNSDGGFDGDFDSNFDGNIDGTFDDSLQTLVQGELPQNPEEDGDADDEETEEDVRYLASSFVAPPQAPVQQYTGEQPSFYGFPQCKAHEESTRSELRYQDKHTDVGFLPAPQNGLRLKLDDYLDDVGAKHRRDPEYQISHLLEHTSWGGHVRSDADALRTSWVHSPGGVYVLRGLPLVEDVDFVVARNDASPAGDCYWRALAYNLYGSGERHWDLVKAEHLGYLHAVLTDRAHPRHALYADTLNARFFSSAGPTERTAATFRANLWQLLHLPHAWTPGAMQQVTADLYNVQVVTFAYNEGTRVVGEVSVRGVYNARHVFMVFHNDCHFQPAAPNSYTPWEFRYPRVTVDATKGFVLAPREGSAKTTVEHPWRNDYTKAVPPPVPRSHGCDVDRLRNYMGSWPRP
ncbi:hypothetical protein F5B20DRAFT_586067 [Whalleya microplaca]|nr:hypothetical protein F5B20DRAFT_586067 [Whalleya microplaca]